MAMWAVLFYVHKLISLDFRMVHSPKIESNFYNFFFHCSTSTISRNNSSFTMHMKFGQSGARGKKFFLKRVNVHDLVCLVLIGVYCPSREFFTHMEMSPLPMKGCKFWHARHSWPLSGEGSLACHTYCDMGHPFL